MSAPTTATSINLNKARTNQTNELMRNLQALYNELNAGLFSGQLPQVIIRLLNKKSKGSYKPAVFAEVANGSEKLDQITVNPIYFEDIRVVAAWMAHNMVHHWQQHFGNDKPSRITYHNAEFAKKLESIGFEIIGSGQDLDQKPIDGGAFDRVFSRSEVVINWKSTEVEGADADGQAPAQPASNSTPTSQPVASTPAASRSRGKGRSKYTCPVCNLNAWAKPGVNSLYCGCNNRPNRMVEN